MKLAQQIEQVMQDLAAYEPEKVILFGSAARGDVDEYSDIDLIVIKETDKRFVQRLVEVGLLMSAEVSVDAFVYTPDEFQRMIDEENPFIENALREGKVLYEKTSGNSPALAG